MARSNSDMLVSNWFCFFSLCATWWTYHHLAHRTIMQLRLLMQATAICDVTAVSVAAFHATAASDDATVLAVFSAAAFDATAVPAASGASDAAFTNARH